MLLDEGVPTPLSGRWGAVIDAASKLARTPLAFDRGTVANLERAGLDEAQVVDLIHASAFFNWANRLMLSLGEPTPPATT